MSMSRFLATKHNTNQHSILAKYNLMMVHLKSKSAALTVKSTFKLTYWIDSAKNYTLYTDFHQQLILVCLPFAGNIPWSGYHATEIKTEVVDNRNMLEIGADIKNPFNIILQYGLTIEPKGRQLTVEQFRDILAQVVVVRHK